MTNAMKKQTKANQITAVLIAVFFLLQPLSSLSFADDYSGVGGDGNVPTQPAGNPAGDYNRNGIVDAADWIIWRKTSGQSVTPGSGADGNGDGIVDSADQVIWQQNFGATLPPPVIDFPVTDFSAQAPILVPIYTPCASEPVHGFCFDSVETTIIEQTLMDRVRVNYDLSEVSDPNQKTAGVTFHFDWNPSGTSNYFDAADGVTFGLRSEAEVGDADRFKIVFEDSSGQQAEVTVEGIERNFKAFEITSAMILSANASINLQYIAQILFVIDLSTTGDALALGFIELATAGVQYVWNPDLNDDYEIPEHPAVSVYGQNRATTLTSDPDADRYQMQFEFSKWDDDAAIRMDFVNEPGGILDVTNGFVMGFQAEGTSRVSLVLIDEADSQVTIVLDDLTNQYMNYVISPHMVSGDPSGFDFSRIKSVVISASFSNNKNELEGQITVSSAKRVSFTGTMETQPDIPVVIPVYNDAGERLTVTSITRPPTEGTLTIGSNGTSVIYTPQNTEDGPRIATFRVEGFTAAGAGGSGSTGGMQAASVTVHAAPRSGPANPPPLPPHDPADPILKEQDVLLDSEIDLKLHPSEFVGYHEPSISHRVKHVTIQVIANGVPVQLSGDLTMDWKLGLTGSTVTITADLKGMKPLRPLSLTGYEVVEVTYNRTVVWEYGFIDVEPEKTSDQGSAKVKYQILWNLSGYDSFVSDEFNISIGLLNDNATHKWIVDHKYEEKTKRSAPDGSNPESKNADWTVLYKYGIPYSKNGYEEEESKTERESVSYTKFEHKLWTGPLDPTYRFYQDFLENDLTEEYERLTITENNKYGLPKLKVDQFLYDLEEEKAQTISDTMLGDINSYSDDFEKKVYFPGYPFVRRLQEHQKRHYGETMTDEEEKKISRSFLKEEWNLYGLPTSYLLEESGHTLNREGIKILDSATFESRTFEPYSSNIDVKVQHSWSVRYYGDDGRPKDISLSYYNNEDETEIRDDRLNFGWVYYDPQVGGDFYVITSVRMPADTFPSADETLLDSLRDWYQTFRDDAPGDYPDTALGYFGYAAYDNGASVIPYEYV